jgi:hypothetical protein
LASIRNGNAYASELQSHGMTNQCR